MSAKTRENPRNWYSQQSAQVSCLTFSIILIDLERGEQVGKFACLAVDTPIYEISCLEIVDMQLTLKRSSLSRLGSFFAKVMIKMKAN